MTEEPMLFTESAANKVRDLILADGNPELKLRVYERGVGETPACGTGACAAAVAGIRQGRVRSPVKVEMPGGNLRVDWAGGSEPVWLTGRIDCVYEGRVDL